MYKSSKFRLVVTQFFQFLKFHKPQAPRHSLRLLLMGHTRISLFCLCMGVCENNWHDDVKCRMMKAADHAADKVPLTR